MSDNTFSIVLQVGRREKRTADARQPRRPISHRHRQRRCDQCAGARLSGGRLPAQRRNVPRPRARSRRQVAYVERRETDYYTQAVLESNVRITGERATSDAVPRPRSATATSTSPGRPSRSRRSNSPRARTSAWGRSTSRPRTCKRRPSGSRRTTTCGREMKAAGLRASEGVVRPAQSGGRRAAAGGDVRQPRPGRRGGQQEPRPHRR